MKTYWTVFAVMLSLSTPLGAQSLQSLIDQVDPDPAWALTGEPVAYDAEDLPTLVGDNAAAALQYGLVGASRFGVAGTEGTVEVTLFEMLDSTASYGLFALERDWRNPDFEPAVVGAESYRLGGALVFWQSKYVGRIDGPRAASTAFGRWLTEGIFGGSRKAPVSELLPTENMIAESEKYLLGPAVFEREVGLDPAPLGFDNNVEVAFVEYRREGSTAKLAMLLYPTLQLATLHLDAWLAESGGGRPHQKVGPLLAIVTENSDPALAASILASVDHSYEITWNESAVNPLEGFPQLILTIFTWIGIALLLTTIGGLGFGGLRIYMKTRYPGRLFGAAEGEEFIQLNIGQRVTSKQLPR